MAWDCTKEKFDTKSEATKKMLLTKRGVKGRRAGASRKKPSHAYKCDHCGFYHWGHYANKNA